MKSLKLKSVRPYVFDNMILHDHNIQAGGYLSLADAVNEYVDQYIEDELLPKATEQLTGMSIVLDIIFLKYRIFI